MVILALDAYLVTLTFSYFEKLHYGNFSMITWEFLLITYIIYIYELNFNFTNIYFAYHKIMVYYIDFW